MTDRFVHLQTPITALSGIAATLRAPLKRLGLETVRDLIYTFPVRYDDLSKTTPITDAKEGTIGLFRGVIANLKMFRIRGGRAIIQGALKDKNGHMLKLVWFGQQYVIKALHVGDEVFLAGKVTRDGSALVLQSPTYEKVKQVQLHTGRLVPFYGLTEGLSQKQLRFLLSKALPAVREIRDATPEHIREQYTLIGIQEAIKEAHFPSNWGKLKCALDRLKFDELLLWQLTGARARAEFALTPAPVLHIDDAQLKQFAARLPFTLSNAQRVAAWEIITDMSKEHPMNRLLEGEVGSGKTVVAAFAMYVAIKAGYQSAILAPTEILAQQHAQVIETLLGNYGVRVALVTSTVQRVNGKETDHIYEAISTGSVPCIIGTHALLSEQVKFAKLGLVVVDEQHRFGVKQRQALRERSGLSDQALPHLLSMSATPIPRTLALALYGDLELSVLPARASGRPPVATRIANMSELEDIWADIRARVAKGAQVFIVAPRISNDAQSAVSVESLYEQAQHELAGLNIAMLHGRLNEDQKTAVFDQFRNGAIAVLVASTVIEVGIDVPNATLVVIFAAERFGLAQLHQLRGRVGRGAIPGTCIIVRTSDEPNERLDGFIELQDAFALAELDLKLRGPGDLYGTMQSGLPAFKIELLADPILIRHAREAAQALIASDATLGSWPLLAAILQDWTHAVHFE